MSSLDLLQQLDRIQTDYNEVTEIINNDPNRNFEVALQGMIFNLSQSIEAFDRELPPPFSHNIQLTGRISALAAKIQLLNVLYLNSQPSPSPLPSSSSSAKKTFRDKVSFRTYPINDDILQIHCANQYNLNQGLYTCGFHSLKNALCAIAAYKEYPLVSQKYIFEDRKIYKHIERLVCRLRSPTITGDATEVQLRDAWSAIVENREHPFPGVNTPLKWDAADLSFFHVGDNGIVTTDQLSMTSLINLKKFSEKEGPCLHAIIIGYKDHWITIVCEKNVHLTWYGLDSADNKDDQFESSVDWIIEAMENVGSMAPRLYYNSIGEEIENRSKLIGPNFKLLEDNADNRKVFNNEKETFIPTLVSAVIFLSEMGWLNEPITPLLIHFIGNIQTILTFYWFKGEQDPLIETMLIRLSKFNTLNNRWSPKELQTSLLSLKFSDSSNLKTVFSDMLYIEGVSLETIELIMNFLKSYPEADRLNQAKNFMVILKKGKFALVAKIIRPCDEALSQQDWKSASSLIDVGLLEALDHINVNESDLVRYLQITSWMLDPVNREFRGSFLLSLSQKLKTHPEIAESILVNESLLTDGFCFKGPVLDELLNQACIALLKRALETKSKILAEQAEFYIQNRTGFKVTLPAISFDHIYIEIKHCKTNTFLDETTRKFLNGISSTFDESIIKMTLSQGKKLSIEQIKLFSEFGSYVTDLFLTSSDIQKEVSDEELKILLKMFPKISYLNIQSGKVTEISLIEINQLSHLNSLTLHHCDIATIKELPSTVKSLRVISCMKLKSLNMLIHLEDLMMNGCYDFERLSKCPPNLIKLSISDCRIILDVRLPFLQNLSISYCPRIQRVYFLCDTLETLSLVGNEFLFEIEQFPANLKTLIIKECKKLEELPAIPPNLQYVSIKNCKKLSQSTRIKILETLIETNFGLAKGMVRKLKIEDMSKFEEKFAKGDVQYYLENLNEFVPANQEFRRRFLGDLIKKDPQSALVNAPRLGIEDKQMLKELMIQLDEVREFLQRYPSLVTDEMDTAFMCSLFSAIEFNDIDTLSDLLSLPNAKKEFSHVYDHPIVRNYIQQNIYLIMDNEPFLDALVEVFPPLDESNASFYPFRVALDDDKKIIKIDSTLQFPYNKPIEALRALGVLLKLERGESLPQKLFVFFYGEEGVDRGGLGRQLIYSLFNGLIHNQSTVKFIKRANGQYLPTLRETEINSEEIETYECLGRVFAFLLCSEIEYPIGEIFDVELFRHLKVRWNVKDSRIYQEQLFERVDPIVFLKICQPFFDKEEDYSNISAVLTATHFQSLSSDLIEYMKKTILFDKIDDQNFKDAQKEFFEMIKGPYLSVHVAIHAIAKGIKGSLPFNVQEDGGICIKNWQSWISYNTPNPYQPVLDLYGRIQGVVSKEDFKNALVVEVDEGGSETESEDCEESETDDAIIEQVRTWVYEWIESADIEQIRRLLILITGAPAITGKIKIELSDQFNFQSCFNTLEIPEQFITKKLLIKELEKSTKTPLKTSEYRFNTM